MKELNCPVCGDKMEVRIQNKDHVNSASKKVSKHKYYQYYCKQHDNELTGWTTTESDILSLKL